jgi:hypothetical protein
MSGTDLGVVLFAVWTASVVAVPTTTFVVALRRRRRITTAVGVAGVVAFLVLSTGWWVTLSPVVDGGVTCMPGDALSGLLDDASAMSGIGSSPAVQLSCRDLARQIAGGWGLAGLVAFAAWLVAVVRAPQRTPVAPARPEAAEV